MLCYVICMMKYIYINYTVCLVVGIERYVIE
jgi:hypothetical protein